MSNADVTRGKEQLKAAVLHDLDAESRLVGDIGAQAVLLGSVQSAAQIVAAIDSVSDADVNAVNFSRYHFSFVQYVIVSFELLGCQEGRIWKVVAWSRR